MGRIPDLAHVRWKNGESYPSPIPSVMKGISLSPHGLLSKRKTDNSATSQNEESKEIIYLQRTIHSFLYPKPLNRLTI